MANPQPTDAHLIMAHSISEAIMMRDFSKLQRKILDLILRLSWGCGKKYAYIPHQRDFMIVGVHEVKIKHELDWLLTSKIIFRQETIYWFNKNFDEWQISRVHPFEPEKLNDLLSINLNGAGAEKLNELLSSDLTNSEVLNELLNKNLTNSLTGTKQIVKLSTPVLASPKEILKKDNNSNNNVFKLYEENIGVINSVVSENLRDAEKEYGADWVESAIKEAVKKNVHNWSYIEKILINWKSKGFKESTRDGKNRNSTGLPKKYTPAPADPRLDAVA